MVKQRQMWEASDGKLYASEALAQEAEREQMVVKKVTQMVDNALGFDARHETRSGRYDQRDAIVRFILRNRRELFSLLTECEVDQLSETITQR
jgi:adenosyl cobinamide kinase/adenosyl cobinamide phosphate guanylyltransferase